MIYNDDFEYITESKKLSSGIFWIISDSHDLSNHKLLMYDIPCDMNGNPLATPKIALNAKSGLTYNHKKLWDNEVKSNSAHKPYNKRAYNYYPRGRVVISRNRADIYLNPHINQTRFIDEIKLKFGLTLDNIPEVRVLNDSSKHYECFLDWE